jgi:hypothetical protein
MLNSSQDILFYVLAICAILITAFTCWLLYYFIAIIRNVYTLTQLLKGKLEAVDEILKLVKSNLSSASNYINLVVNGIDKIVNYVQNKNSRKKASIKKSKTKPDNNK